MRPQHFHRVELFSSWASFLQATLRVMMRFEMVVFSLVPLQPSPNSEAPSASGAPDADVNSLKF